MARICTVRLRLRVQLCSIVRSPPLPFTTVTGDLSGCAGSVRRTNIWVTERGTMPVKLFS